MSKHIGFYYRCDGCGAENRGRHSFFDNQIMLPDDWYHVKPAKKDFCESCYKEYRAAMTKNYKKVE